MRTRPVSSIIAGAAAGLIAGIACASIERSLWTDGFGDTVVRRTDSGADGALIPGAVLPDVLSVTLLPWEPLNPVENPYSGLPVNGDSARMVRLDVVFVGLVNPPGPLGLNGADFDPTRFGNSPVYGFVELDVDRDRDTGGEFHGPARNRALALAPRFGGRLTDPVLGARMPACAADLDSDWQTAPFFERTGTDFALAFCGCYDATIVSESGNGNGRLDCGETMIVRGRFFQRAGGYRLASNVSGGSSFGQYDPLVDVRFRHEPSSHLTVVTLVFPLTPAGAAALAGEPEQPIDSSIDSGSHFSMLEALADLVAGANGPTFGLTYELVHRWSTKDPAAHLNPLYWDARFVVGTTYEQPEDALYVWTDTGFDVQQGDVNGDGLLDALDRALVDQFRALNDGGELDADGQVDGVVTLGNFGPNFCLYDVDSDGAVGPLDLAWFQFPEPCFADWDQNGVVEVADIFAFLSSWFAGMGDFDGDGVTAVPDIFAFLTAWFRGPCI